MCVLQTTAHRQTDVVIVNYLGTDYIFFLNCIQVTDKRNHKLLSNIHVYLFEITYRIHFFRGYSSYFTCLSVHIF